MTIKQIAADIRATQNAIDATRPGHQIRLARLGDKLFDLKSRYETTLRLSSLTAAA